MVIDNENVELPSSSNAEGGQKNLKWKNGSLLHFGPSSNINLLIFYIIIILYNLLYIYCHYR